MSKRPIFSEGKTVYYVRGNRFFNDSGLRNGKQRALDYCHSNFIDESEIIVFDSILECDRYEYLVEQQKLGKISHLRTHYIVHIQDAYVNVNGDEIPPIDYNADFVYKENGRFIVEDVKGLSLFQDSRFELMKQVFDYLFKPKNTYIRIIIRRDKQWVEWKLGERKKPQKLIKKQSEKIKQLQAEKHQREIQERKTERELSRYKELIGKEKLTSAERKRLIELEGSLREKKIIL
jgi:hypothetical protein